VLLLSECLLLFISLSTQSGNVWIHHRISRSITHTSEWYMKGTLSRQVIYILGMMVILKIKRIVKLSYVSLNEFFLRSEYFLFINAHN
jgi:hypothetical protein